MESDTETAGAGLCARSTRWSENAGNYGGLRILVEDAGADISGRRCLAGAASSAPQARARGRPLRVGETLPDGPDVARRGSK